MAQVQPGFARGIVGMRFTRHGATHMAGEAVAVKHIGARLFGNRAGKRRMRLGAFQQVLAWFEVAAVVVGEDLVALFGLKLPHAARPL